MRCDKVFLPIGGIPLWRRQLRLLQQLGPEKIFLAGPTRPEWIAAGLEIVCDVEDGAGPFAGLVAALRSCSTSLLLALAIDLARMNVPYLKSLLESCAPGRGVVPTTRVRFEPLAAIYPIAALPLGENLLRLGRFSLQDFSASCVAQGLMKQKPVAPEEEEYFLNLNTPEDLQRFCESESR